MLKLVKIKTTFKKLFENYSTEIKDNEIVKPKIKMFIKNGYGELEEITGLIRKNNHNIYTYTFNNGLSFNCSDKHIIKTETGFKLLSDLKNTDNVLIYNSPPINILNCKLYKPNDYVYDLALNGKHEYVTPNGLIHHNTTLARVICSKYGVLQNPNDNLLMVNGSAKKSRGIGFVDEVIEPFLRHPPSRDNFRIVFIDESDKLTNDGYDSLRAIIEKYHAAYGRFIFTCNYVSKIPDAVQSRFSHYAFSQIPKDYLMDYAKRILDSEKIIYEEKTVGLIINNLYPDVRKIVNTLQRNALNGKLDVTEESITTNEKKVMALILQVISCLEKVEDSKIGGIINLIIEILAKQELEYRNIYTDLFFMDKIPTPAKIIINRYSNTHQNCLVPHMHFIAMVFEIIKTLQTYRKAVTGK
jgi:hypothetical protein